MKIVLSLFFILLLVNLGSGQNFTNSSEVYNPSSSSNFCLDYPWYCEAFNAAVTPIRETVNGALDKLINPFTSKFVEWHILDNTKTGELGIISFFIKSIVLFIKFFSSILSLMGIVLVDIFMFLSDPLGFFRDIVWPYILNLSWGIIMLNVGVFGLVEVSIIGFSIMSNEDKWGNIDYIGMLNSWVMLNLKTLFFVLLIVWYIFVVLFALLKFGFEFLVGAGNLIKGARSTVPLPGA